MEMTLRLCLASTSACRGRFRPGPSRRNVVPRSYNPPLYWSVTGCLTVYTYVCVSMLYTKRYPESKLCPAVWRGVASVNLRDTGHNSVTCIQHLITDSLHLQSCNDKGFKDDPIPLTRTPVVLRCRADERSKPDADVRFPYIFWHPNLIHTHTDRDTNTLTRRIYCQNFKTDFVGYVMWFRLTLNDKDALIECHRANMFEILDIWHGKYIYGY